MRYDRDLDIALLALRARMITADQLDQAMKCWSADRSASMADVLESRGLLDGPGRAELERRAMLEADGGGAPSMITVGDSSPDSQGPTMLATLGGTAVEVGPARPAASPPDLIDDAGASPTVAASAATIFEASPSGHVRLSNLDGFGTGEARARYARTHLHAKGGIGQVWLARDGDLGREVALKEMRPEQAHSPAALSRFFDEARITGQLEHPGIVPIYELSARPEDGEPYYTMRFVRGRTLDRAILDYHEKKVAGLAGPLDLASLLTAFVSLCNTAGYAHSRGVIHRDLKGQNVVLGDFGEVILLDWGIAKLVARPDPAEGEPPADKLLTLHGEAGSAHEATIQGQILGTPFYMAPEQAEGRIGAIDARTDVYGLGAILHEILSGRPPFEGTSAAEVMRKVREEPPAPLQVVAPGTPPALRAICSKAMSKRPEDRYPSALALAEDVKRWLADEPISAYREPWTVRLARYSKRHRTAVAAAAALMMTAIVALSVSSVLINRERDEARRQGRQARKAVDDNYTQVAEGWLADRLDPLQREFLEKALAYYRDFAGPDEGDFGLREDRGRAHLRMGDVLRKLGRPDEAEPAYRRAIEILARLADDDPAVAGHRDHLAEATFRLGSERAARGKAAELDEAGRLFRQAASAQEALLAGGPTAARRLALGRTLDAMADLLRVTGRPQDAEAAYRQAIAILEVAAADKGAAVSPLQELGVALDGLGFLLKERGRIEEAGVIVRRAVRTFEELVAEAPTLPGPKEGLAKAYNTLGLLLRDAGTPAESEAVLEKEVALNRRLAADYPTRPEYRRTLARSLMNLGIIRREANRPTEADVAYSEALKINEKLAAEAPEIRKYARDQARCLNNLAELRATRRAEAEPLYRKALQIYLALDEAASGKVAEHRIDAAGVLGNLGIWLSGKGRAAESIEVLERAVALFDGLAVADAEDPAVRRGLARSLNTLGGAYLGGGRAAEAEEAFRRAVNAFDLLVERDQAIRADRIELAACLSNRGSNQTGLKDPGAKGSIDRSLALLGSLASEGPPPPDLRFQLGATENNLGEWLASAGRPGEAEVAFGKSIGLFGALDVEFPKVLAYKGTLGQARANLGEFLVAQGRQDDARMLLERGIAEERAALAASPGGRDTLRKHLATVASIHLDRKAHVEVAKAGEEILKVADVASARPEVARLMARCVPIAAADVKLTEARRALMAGAYADRAIALLREAIESGDPESDRLLREPAFDPIRQRDGFKILEPEKIGQRRPANLRGGDA